MYEGGFCHKRFPCRLYCFGKGNGSASSYVFLQFRIKGNLIENKTQRHCAGHGGKQRALHGARPPRGHKAHTAGFICLHPRDVGGLGTSHLVITHPVAPILGTWAFLKELGRILQHHGEGCVYLRSLSFLLTPAIFSYIFPLCLLEPSLFHIISLEIFVSLPFFNLREKDHAISLSLSMNF